MPHDVFDTERQRVERVLDILEEASSRLERGAEIPQSVLGDALEFIRSSENAAYEAAQISEGEPVLSACIEQHVAARAPVRGMEAALSALRGGDDSGKPRFARFAREYAHLRREHMRLDDRLFSAAGKTPPKQETKDQLGLVESADPRQAYDRLVEAAATLAHGGAGARP